MQRNAMMASIGAVLLAVGCQSPAEKQAEERAEARKEITEAGKDAREKIDDANKDLAKDLDKDAQDIREDARDHGEKVVDATQKINDEVDEAAKEMTRAADDKPGFDNKMDGNRYERFEALKNESHTTFATRADGAIAKLQADLDAARSRAGTSAPKDLAEDLTDADEALKEARKDLDEVRNKTGNVIDDGRIGVATAINKAQRELTDAYGELDKAKM
jgi:hypothetical protein